MAIVIFAAALYELLHSGDEPVYKGKPLHDWVNQMTQTGFDGAPPEAVEAIKQCGNAWLPQVEAPVTPKAYLGRGEKFELPLIASLQSDCRHPREYFKTFYAEKKRLPKTVCVWIGPEGDFTPAEMSAVKSAGVFPITLGRLVLRSETAAIYSLSVLNYELQSKYE